MKFAYLFIADRYMHCTLNTANLTQRGHGGLPGNSVVCITDCLNSDKKTKLNNTKI